MSPIDHDCTPQERNVLLDRIAELELLTRHSTRTLDLPGSPAPEAADLLPDVEHYEGCWQYHFDCAIDRIAELEAEVERVGDVAAMWEGKALSAETHAADCKRLVTACENDLDAERMKRREAEALVNANTDHMTEVGVELCRERDARISELEAENQLVKDDFDRMQRECKHEKIRAEQAEAILLGEDVTVAAYRNMQAALAECKQERGELRKAIRTLGSDYNVLSAALAEMEHFIDSCTYHMRDGDTVSYTGPRAEEAKP